MRKNDKLKLLINWIINKNNEKLHSLLIYNNSFIIAGKAWGEVCISNVGASENLTSILLPAWANLEDVKYHDLADAMCIFLEACDIGYDLSYRSQLISDPGYILIPDRKITLLDISIAWGLLK